MYLCDLQLTRLGMLLLCTKYTTVMNQLLSVNYAGTISKHAFHTLVVTAFLGDRQLYLLIQSYNLC